MVALFGFFLTLPDSSCGFGHWLLRGCRLSHGCVWGAFGDLRGPTADSRSCRAAWPSVVWIWVWLNESPLFKQKHTKTHSVFLLFLHSFIFDHGKSIVSSPSVCTSSFQHFYRCSLQFTRQGPFHEAAPSWYCRVSVQGLVTYLESLETRETLPVEFNSARQRCVGNNSCRRTLAWWILIVIEALSPTTSVTW